ncbi:hypothetical protein BKA70DRAFT_1417324 [Coprinopsis sp. MPI-PUGE-AT-0042]|nr:hypothetical protein BKA70DRAFT_1417324 [Coprinopsis sp. MPI-PUGE-AT-0042]
MSLPIATWSQTLSIPEEILVQVLRFMVNPWARASTNDMRLEAASLFAVSQVSQRWRETALGDASLWAAVTQPNLSAYALEIVLDRARDRPLSIIGVGSIPMELLNTKAHSRLSKNFALIFKEVACWFMLHLTLTPNEAPGWDESDLAVALSKPAPNLHSLSIDNPSGAMIGPPGTPGPPFAMWCTHSSLQRVHIHGLESYFFPLDYGGSFANLTELVLQGFPSGPLHTSLNVNPLTSFSPHALATFLYPMVNLVVVVLDCMMLWDNDVQERRNDHFGPFLPLLQYLEIVDDFLPTAHFLTHLPPSKLVPVVKLHSKISESTNLELDTITSAMDHHLQLLPDCSPEHYWSSWSFGFGRFLLVQAGSPDRRATSNVRIEFQKLTPSTSTLFSLFADILPRHLLRWDFTRAEVLCLRLDVDSEVEWGSTMPKLVDLLLSQCETIRELHLHGVTTLAYEAIAGTSYREQSWILAERCPELETIVVTASSLDPLAVTLEGVQTDFLFNIIRIHEAKHPTVSAIRRIIIVDDIAPWVDMGHSTARRSPSPQDLATKLEAFGAKFRFPTSVEVVNFTNDSYGPIVSYTRRCICCSAWWNGGDLRCTVCDQ